MLGRIAIHLNNDKACTRRIDVGLALAKQHAAEVVGVYPSDGVVGHYYDESIIPQDARRIALERREGFREAVRKQFLESAQAARVHAVWRSPPGEADEAVGLHACDRGLLILSKGEQVACVTSIAANVPE